MDIEMPGMSGIETAKKLNEYFVIKDIKCSIWGLSGYSSDEEKRKCLQNGMKKYFVKPPNIETLVECLREEFEHQKLE
jgi:CheY-like chemotaxis protein